LHAPRSFLSEITLVSGAVILSSLAAYLLLERFLGQSYLLLFASEDFFLFVCLAVSLFGGSEGPLSFVVMVPVALLAYIEELFFNGTLAWVGLVLAFSALIFLPVVGLLFRKTNRDVSAALEVSSLVFLTRLALSPFTVSFLQSSYMIPVAYALLFSTLIAYIWVRRMPLAEVGLSAGSGRILEQIAIGLVAGAVLGYAGLKVLQPPVSVVGSSLLTNSLNVAVTTMGLVALAEELLYRGLVLKKLVRIMPRWQAVHITALLFAIFSIGWFSPLVVILTYAAGSVFGYLMLRYDSLVAPVVAHGFCNMALYLLAVFL